MFHGWVKYGNDKHVPIPLRTLLAITRINLQATTLAHDRFGMHQNDIKQPNGFYLNTFDISFRRHAVGS